MRKLLLLCVAAVLVAPVASLAHEPVTAQRCVDQSVPGASKDCVRVDTDTEFEGGLHVNLDGDDSDPRGDDISDGYIHVQVSREGQLTVSCEDEGNYNYPDTSEDDANGDNDDCEP